MRRRRPLFALTLLAALALILPVSLPADAEPSGPTTPQEYVVVYTGSAEQAEKAIEAAGGQVVDVNEDAKIAKVSTTESGFVAKADRAADVTAVVRNHAVGTAKPGLPHRYASERPTGADKAAGAKAGHRNKKAKRSTEPLADRQWDMDLIGVDQAHKKATGRGVDVGIIDTGIDASHPDLAKNFDRARSRNFTQDIPAIDGPCEVSTCIDPADTDDGGHGTHVAGTVAADDNKLGIGGVAPDATLVNLRAGQDSGYFFLYETVAALVEAGNLRLDVVNMSFYTDPWLYNCASKADYVSGDGHRRGDRRAGDCPRAGAERRHVRVRPWRHPGGCGRQRAHRPGHADPDRRQQPGLPGRHGGHPDGDRQLPRSSQRGAPGDLGVLGRTVDHQGRLLQLRPR